MYVFRKLLLLLLITIIKTFITCDNNVEILNLNGDDWIVTQSNNSVEYTASVPGGKVHMHTIEYPASVPGGIYTDLMRANAIGDVFFGDNDTATRWVGNTNWTYTKNFTVMENSSVPFSSVSLIFDGVDTFADIVLNDVSIGETDNMFVRYIFNVTGKLNPGINTLKINFKSPTEIGKILNDKQLESYVVPPECPPDEYRGECHVNMLRKMQSSFSWDWGPAFPSVGLWKSVYLESTNGTVIRDIVSQVKDIDDNNWGIDFDIYLANNVELPYPGIVNVTIRLDDNNELNYEINSTVNSNEYNETLTSVIVIVPKEKVNLWWPNGFGQQQLYQVDVGFTPLNSSDATTKKQIRLGFRTVEIIQDNLDNGATFYLKVNNEPIFAKGANEIPINVLPELGQVKETVKYILSSAKEVHMNMLRVWGGGIYESDYFYDLADEYGIMIWQDFLFASSMYPINDKFLNSVREEINFNTKRLYNHPSIVIYSGNNENEGNLAYNTFGTKDNFTLYKTDYITLYIDTVREEFLRITNGSGIFVGSSPSNGKGTENEGWVAGDPANQVWGDIHYYNYGDDLWNSTIYPVPRFCSEYGAQSLPFETTWMTATNDEANLNISSTFMSNRQHHQDGNNQITKLIETYFVLPDSSSAFFTKAFIYYSEIYSAQGIKVESEHYRRYRSYLQEDGRGYTMGALYWQLNDVWVAPSWSSIDFTGRWKMLHYFAKKMFSPIIITGHMNNVGALQLYTVNDNLNSIENVTTVVKVFKYDSPDFQPVYENRSYVDLNASSSQLIETIFTDPFLTANNCGDDETGKQNCFFYFSIENISSSIGPDNYVFPEKPRYANLAKTTVTISSIKQISSTEFDITIKATNIALFVWLDSKEIKGKFSDNGFLQVEAEKLIKFYSEQEISSDELQNQLSITHLKDESWN